jgi:linoleoyl-CoA desaturase
LTATRAIVPNLTAPAAACDSRNARYQPKSAFSAELHSRVEAYFTSAGLRKRDLPRMYFKTFVVLAWCALSYIGLLHTSTFWMAGLLSVSLGLSMAAIGFNVQHDGNHGAYSRRESVNQLMARSLDLLGGSAYFWRFKHNIAHHTHTNISGQDDDISLGVLGRLSPHDPWRSGYRFQHFYVWALYALLALEWQTTGEFRNLISKRRIGRTRVPFPCRAEHALFWVGKVVFFGLAFALPLATHSISAVVGCYLISTVTLGLTLAVVFQLAHCVEEARFTEAPSADDMVAREWTAHQVESTVNFAPGGRLVTWFVGGLNYQIEHHLFPRVCHLHYPALAPIVAQVCREYHVQYFSHPTMRAALRSHFRWLRAMGRPVPAAQGLAVPASRSLGAL